jgi:uncharacterized membrane protein
MERRPRLYLFGLSLGARNSDLSADIFDVIADPYQGALWVGPPWDTVTWRKVTAMRAAGSPVWLHERERCSANVGKDQRAVMGHDDPWAKV